MGNIIKREDILKGMYIKKPTVMIGITFEELVEYGKKQEGANIVDGMPWSFDYKDVPITHENDSCYLIQTLTGMQRMGLDDVLMSNDAGELIVVSGEELNGEYIELN